MTSLAPTDHRSDRPRPPGVTLRGRDGTTVTLAVADWIAPATTDERAVLAGVVGPAIDLGCGPGRVLEALDDLGIEAMGVDTSRAALDLCRRRDLVVLERSIFADLPAAGRWRTAILLDGNVGIGGDPVALLRRAAALLAADGRLLVEVHPPDVETRTFEVRVESPGLVGPWFPWAIVGAGSLEGTAARAGLRVDRLWSVGPRWFAWLGCGALSRAVGSGT